MTSKEQLMQLKQIVEKFEKSVKETTTCALNSPKGGDQNWYKLLAEHEVEQATVAQKEAFYSQGVPDLKGAIPLELRKVYLQLRYDAVKEFMETLSDEELSVDAEIYWNDFTNKLEDFIDEEISSYIGKIKQEVGVSDIFANAFTSMNQFSQGLKESGLNTKQCQSCGSPRLDEDQYRECYFCGTPLFETKKVEARCKFCGSPKFIEDQGKVCQFCGN